MDSDTLGVKEEIVGLVNVLDIEVRDDVDSNGSVAEDSKELGGCDEELVEGKIVDNDGADGVDKGVEGVDSGDRDGLVEGELIEIPEGTDVEGTETAVDYDDNEMVLEAKDNISPVEVEEVLVHVERLPRASTVAKLVVLTGGLIPEG